MDASIKKIIELIQKTGDRFIIWETDSNTPYVVMSLADYEKLLAKPEKPKAHSESQLLEKINSDIALWRAKQEMAVAQKAPPVVPLAPPLSQSTAKEEVFLTEEAPAVAEAETAKEDDKDQYNFEPVES
ncbi:MAG: hypothetical protein AAB568_03850 [Patescibacteria group bacterium]